MDVTANKKSYIIHRSMGYGNLWLLGAELLGIYCLGAPRESSELKIVYDISCGCLLGENSSIDLTVKKYFSVVTQMPSVALCLWISLFMILYALVEGKWRYLLFFIPCLGNIATLLVATPITYWPRYGLSFICLLPISALFPYLLKELEES